MSIVDDRVLLLPSSCILADDIDVVSHFLTSIFDTNSIDNNNSTTTNSDQTSPTNSTSSIRDKSVKYSSIRINDKNNIMIIQKSSVSDTLLSVVRSISVRQIFVTCKDPGIYYLLLLLLSSY